MLRPLSESPYDYVQIQIHLGRVVGEHSIAKFSFMRNHLKNDSYYYDSEAYNAYVFIGKNMGAFSCEPGERMDSLQ